MGPNMTTPAIHGAVTFNGDILIVSGSQFCINNTQGPYQLDYSTLLPELLVI